MFEAVCSSEFEPICLVILLEAIVSPSSLGSKVSRR